MFGRFSFQFIFLLIITIFIFSCTASIAISQEVTILEPRISIERELASGQKHNYQTSIQKGQYAKVIINQDGLDVLVRLIGTDTNIISEFDTELRLKGEENVELIAETAGTYKLEVESKNKSGPLGHYQIRFSELRTATDKDRSLEEARKLIRDMNKLLEEDKIKEALPLAERALSIREEVQGPDDPAVAKVLYALADIHYSLGEYDAADVLFQRALAIQEKTLSNDDPDLARTMTGLGRMYYEMGKYLKSESLLKRALEIMEKAFGPDHVETGRAVNRLGALYFYIGDYRQAELLNKRWLTIAGKLFGENHPSFAKALGNVANVYTELGDYEKAESMHLRSLKIIEKSYGADNAEITPGLIMVGNLYFRMGQYEKAIHFFQRALTLDEKAGNDDLAVTVSLENLGSSYVAQGEYAKAEPFIQRALARLEASLGHDNLNVAGCTNSLADLYRAQGEFTKAEPLYRSALEIYEKTLGPEHPFLAAPLKGLAILYRAKGEITQSLKYQARSNEIIEKNLAYNLAVGSERQKLAYLTTLSEEADRTLSLHIQTAPHQSDACMLAATAVLQRKGRVLDWMADSLSALRHNSNAEDQAKIDQLNDTNSQLANLILNGPQKMSITHQQKIKDLEEEREKLESEISRLSAGFYQPSVTVTVSAVQAAIPSTAALIEFTTYRSFDPKEPDHKKAFGEPRYVAYVLRPQAEVQWKELGDVKTIDTAIDTFREALRDPKRNDVKRIANRLYEKIMQPVQSLVGDITQILISPDGALNLIPFEALVDEKNHYLVERFSFTYLTSGRDLLRLQVRRQNKTDLVVLANPMFGEPEVVNTLAQSKMLPASAKRESVTIGNDLSEVYFAPLAGTAQEAKTIKSLFPKGSVLTGTQATESSLKRITAPLILHIATHGFFLTDNKNPNSKIQNPLLRSGLALAGANLHKNKDDDGILTALEASGLNLWGTKLVTLSACDTGLGEVKNGEGVYGLRRSFVLAGTETLVMSLWPVSDFVTREMMTGYYQGLKQGLGRGQSLRQVQETMIHRKEREHPFYWASFIQSGEWANLDGKR